MQIKIDIDDNQLNQIVAGDLGNILSVLKSDLKRVKKSKKGYVFDLDYKTDLALINAKILAFEEVIDYYGVPKKS